MRLGLSGCWALLAAMLAVEASAQTTRQAPSAPGTVRMGTVARRQANRPGLPPFAVVQEKEGGAQAWRETGLVRSGFNATDQAFRTRFRQGGWHFVMRIPERAGRHGGEPLYAINVWQKGAARVLLILWENGLSETGFTWGTEPGQGGL